MKRLRRVIAQAAFLSGLILFSSVINISIFAQQTSPDESIARMSRDAESLALDVTVTDKDGKYIDGLDKSAFTLYDNKAQQELAYFASGDEPLSVGIVFDLSGSMIDSQSLTTARSAVLRFIEQSHNANDYCVIAFTTRPLVLIDWIRGSQAAALALSRYYFTSGNKKNISLNTALYDSLYLGLEKMRGGAHPKQVILLISDGQDNESHYTFTEVRQRLKETGVLLYSIGIVGGNLSGSSLGMEGQSILDEWSAVSGGKAFFPENKKEIAEIFDRIALELRHQYVLGFKPSKQTADGKWHRLKIKVTPPLNDKGRKQSVFVRYRDGFYADKNLR